MRLPGRRTVPLGACAYMYQQPPLCKPLAECKVMPVQYFCMLVPVMIENSVQAISGMQSHCSRRLHAVNQCGTKRDRIFLSGACAAH